MNIELLSRPIIIVTSIVMLAIILIVAWPLIADMSIVPSSTSTMLISSRDAYNDVLPFLLVLAVVGAVAGMYTWGSKR